MAPLLETEYIRLRALEREDIERLYLWENDTNIWSVSETYAPFSKTVLEEFVASQRHDIYVVRQLRMVMERVQDKEAVGAVDIFDFDPHSRRAAVGILVYDRSQRGRGYGRQALELVMEYSRSVLDMRQLYCDVFADNEASLALFDGAGFRRIGVKQSWCRVGAEWKDAVMFQKLF